MSQQIQAEKHFATAIVAVRLLGAAIVSDQLFDFSVTAAEANMVSGHKYGLLHFVYLAAIALATVGWLCFIAWIAVYLV